MNAFTACYQQLMGGDGNLILPPFTIATALSMALAGARGHTRRNAIGPAQPSPVNELNTANGLWVQKGFAIQPAFENTLANNYQVPLRPLDFIANPEGRATQINRWTEEHTNEKIKNLLPAGSLNAETRRVLTSAIYFYGKWQDPFVTSRTRACTQAAATPMTIIALIAIRPRNSSSVAIAPAQNR